MKFCVETWQKMSQKTKSQLTETAQNLFHLLEQFAKLELKIVFSFEKILDLSDDLFCIGDLTTRQDCIEAFNQFVNNEPFDFFDLLGEIREIMDFIDMELKTFKKLLTDLLSICPYFIKNKRNMNVFKEMMEVFYFN